MSIQYGFLFNQSRCVGCNTCVVACKDWNGINPGKVRLRWHEEIPSGALPDFGTLGAGQSANFKIYNMLHSCFHCSDPKCVKACGLGAIKKDATNGRVYIDKTVCQGLRSCETIAGCPYHNISHVEEGSDQETVKDSTWLISHPAHKCNMCEDRLSEGKQPACVASCLTRALDFGDMDELRQKYPTATQENVTGFEDLGTKPNWLFIKK